MTNDYNATASTHHAMSKEYAAFICRAVNSFEELVEALESNVSKIEYALRWLESEQKAVETRCNKTGITGAHKQSDMLNIGVAVENLKDARREAQAAIAKATSTI